MLTIVLALFSSFGYGVADFIAGRVSQRVNPALMVLYSQAAQAMIVLVAAIGQPFAAGALAWGTVAGLLNAVGLVLYYQALAQGPAGVVAPLVSSSMVVPVIVSIVTGNLRSPLTLLGLAVVAAGVVVAVMRSHTEPDDRDHLAPSPCRGAQRPRGERVRIDHASTYLVSALIATLAFGGFFLVVDRGSASAGAGVLWVTFGVQLGALPPTIGRVLSGGKNWSLTIERALLPSIAILSIFNLGGDVALAYALAGGNVAIVSVLASLGPVVTGMLARLATNERLTLAQSIGAGLTLFGTLLVAYVS